MVWQARRSERVIGALVAICLFGGLQGYQDRAHPFSLALDLTFATFLVVSGLRTSRLAVHGDVLTVSGWRRTRRLHAYEIAGFLETWQGERTLVIWARDGRRVSTAAVGHGRRKSAQLVPGRMAALERWWLDNRGDDWQPGVPGTPRSRVWPQHV